MTNSSTTSRPQRSFEEKDLSDNADLVSLVNGFMVAKGQAKEPNRRKKLAKDNMEEKLEELELGNGEYRVGEFIITRSESESRDVEFTRRAGHRWSVKVAK